MKIQFVNKFVSSNLSQADAPSKCINEGCLKLKRKHLRRRHLVTLQSMINQLIIFVQLWDEIATVAAGDVVSEKLLSIITRGL